MNNLLTGEMAWEQRLVHHERFTHLEGNFLVLIEEHAQLADADSEVPVRELVGDVEPQCSKLSPLQGDTVEHTQ